MAPTRLTLEVPREPVAAAFARDRLTAAFPDLPRTTTRDVLLAASELVTNAVRHGTGAIRLTVERLPDRLRLEVVDEGDAAWEVRPEPPDRTGGWGLHIIEALSLRWGSFPGTTHVWCEIPLAPAD